MSRFTISPAGARCLLVYSHLLHVTSLRDSGGVHGDVVSRCERVCEWVTGLKTVQIWSDLDYTDNLETTFGGKCPGYFQRTMEKHKQVRE